MDSQPSRRWRRLAMPLGLVLTASLGLAGAAVASGQDTPASPKKDGEGGRFTHGQSAVGHHHAGDNRFFGIDAVVGTTGTGQRHVTGQIGEGRPHRNHIAGIFDVVGGGKGAGPGDAPITAADGGERAVL